jgi:hypothetical protein
MFRITTLVAAALTAGTASAQTRFTHLATIDVGSTSTVGNPEYVGVNPSGVAWTGTRLFVAGFNNSGIVGTTAIVEVLDPLGTPSYGATFGVQAATPGSRGYSGLDIKGDTLAAAWDDGAADPLGIVGYDVSTPGTAAQAWAQNGRGGSGVGFDPGFSGIDFGTGWTSFGSGRRSLNNEVTGAVIYDSTNGTIINGAGTGTFWRDMDYEDDSGDIWLREGNNVIRAPRTGGNTTSTALLVRDEFEADNINGQNLAYINSSFGDVVIYNERSQTAGVQDFFVVIKVCTPSGALHTVDWGTFTPPGLNAGYFDFSWAPDPGTLAILDFTLRRVYIFKLEPPTGSVSYCTAGTSTNGCSASISSTGTASASMATPFDIAVSGVDGQRSGIIFYGVSGAVASPWGTGTSFLCVKSPTQRTVSQNSGGTAGACDGTLALDWNAWMSANPSALGSPYLSGDQFHAQGWYRDPPAPKTTNLSNGVSFFLGP